MSEVSFIPLIKAQNRPHTVLPYVTPQPSNKDVERRRQRMGFVRVKPLRQVYTPPKPPSPPEIPTIKTPAAYVGKTQRDWLDLSPNKKLSGRKIRMETAERYGVSLAIIDSPSRNKVVVKARHECFYRLRHELGWSLPQIAKAMNRADHTTVISGIKRHELRLQMPEIDEVAPQHREPELQALISRYTRRGERYAMKKDNDQ